MCGLKQITSHGEVVGYRFWCPACECYHAFYTKLNKEQKKTLKGGGWSFNGNLEKPTFSPSLRCRWNTDGSDKLDHCCHLNLIDGIIHYCKDCTHKLKGQKIPLNNEEDD